MKPYLALIVALGLAACMKDGATNTDADLQPGQIQLQSLSKVSSSGTDSSSNYVFNLDTAKSSIEQEFILQNTGDYDVKNVKLTTNNSHFYFTPSEIPILPSSKKSMILQVIKLKVIHGLRLDGVGTDSMLPKGNNIAMAQITANTSNSRHDSVNISQNAQLKVFAKVMDMDIFIGSSTIPLGPPSGQVLSSGGSGPYINVAGATTLRFKNTGNTDITLKDAVSGVKLAYLKIDSSLNLTGYPENIEPDGQGTISDPVKFPQTSGKIVLRLLSPSNSR